MLIFRQYPELMKRLDLHNEYELHAVLKKKRTGLEQRSAMSHYFQEKSDSSFRGCDLSGAAYFSD